jgi:peptide/nickel transport system substrate-binding protein
MIVYKALDSYSQPEWMDALVASGQLPPVEERLPKEPQVFLASGMSTGLGEYGGIWRDFSACPTEGWNLGAGQTQGWFGINIIYQEALLKSGPIFMRNDAVEPFPNLAKSREWSDDGTELTMELIEGAKWSDGEPFDVSDVMFTWEHLIHGRSKAKMSILKPSTITPSNGPSRCLIRSNCYSAWMSTSSI